MSPTKSKIWTYHLRFSASQKGSELPLIATITTALSDVSVVSFTSVLHQFYQVELENTWPTTMFLELYHHSLVGQTSTKYPDLCTSIGGANEGAGALLRTGAPEMEGPIGNRKSWYLRVNTTTWNPHGHFAILWCLMVDELCLTFRSIMSCNFSIQRTEKTTQDSWVQLEKTGGILYRRIGISPTSG